MAWAPPTLNTVSMPHNSAATSTAGLALPLRAGGVQRMRLGHPAIRAGTANMITAEGRGAEPAGTYKPTVEIARTIRSQRTPGIVSTIKCLGNCPEWNL